MKTCHGVLTSGVRWNGNILRITPCQRPPCCGDPCASSSCRYQFSCGLVRAGGKLWSTLFGEGGLMLELFGVCGLFRRVPSSGGATAGGATDLGPWVLRGSWKYGCIAEAVCCSLVWFVCLTSALSSCSSCTGFIIPLPSRQTPGCAIVQCSSEDVSPMVTECTCSCLRLASVLLGHRRCNTHPLRLRLPPSVLV